MLYFPSATHDDSPAARGLVASDVALVAADGVRLHGWWLPAAERRATLLFLHGNAGNVSHRLDRALLLQRLGLDLLLVDYRGYGHSAGKPSESGLALDAQAAWRHLTGERGVAPRSIVLYGESLGGAVAARLAAEVSPGALVLDSAFTSVPDLGAELYPWLPVRLLARSRYDTRAALARVDSAVLILHARDDEIVPFSHAERNLAAARGTKRLVALRGGHNDAWWTDRATYEEALRGFLDAVFVRSA